MVFVGKVLKRLDWKRGVCARDSVRSGVRRWLLRLGWSRLQCRTIDRPAAAEEQAGVVEVYHQQTTHKGQARRELLLTPELLSPVVA